MTLKTALVAPAPSARDNSAVRVNPGRRRSSRAAYRKSADRECIICNRLPNRGWVRFNCTHARRGAGFQPPRFRTCLPGQRARHVGSTADVAALKGRSTSLHAFIWRKSLAFRIPEFRYLRTSRQSDHTVNMYFLMLFFRHLAC